MIRIPFFHSITLKFFFALLITATAKTSDGVGTQKSHNGLRTYACADSGGRS